MFRPDSAGIRPEQESCPGFPHPKNWNKSRNVQPSPSILAVHSDTSCLSEPKARSRAGGHFFLTSYTTLPPNDGAVLNIAHIIKSVISTDTEAELMGLYIMARKAVYIRIILEELGHKQPPTPQQTDNTIAEAIINGKIQPKQTKAMDIRFHWLRDCECQQQFRV